MSPKLLVPFVDYFNSLLLNENRKIKVKGEEYSIKIAIIGKDDLHTFRILCSVP